MHTGSISDRNPVKRVLPWLLLASCMAFLLLSFVPGARQQAIFSYDELCDYRMFVLPSMTSERPYFESSARLRDACYPPIAYLAVKALATDRGVKWNLSAGEIRLLLSLFLAQCIGVALLAGMIPRRSVRLAAAVAVLMSPACICTILRGNPSGWSFALVCVFLFWYRSNDAIRRMAAAVALGAATSLKVAPCLFGVLFLAEAMQSRRIPWREIAVSALSAALLTFLPFALFGGFDAIPQWIANASANAEFYSVDNPIWGLAALANHVIDSKEVVLPCIGRFAWATRAIAAMLVVAAVFSCNNYRRLLYIGAAMALLTYHDYGGTYLIPAFVAWLCEVDGSHGRCSGVVLLLESVAWFFILTPLQIPNPCFPGSLNVMLQNELLFVLLVVSLFPVGQPRQAA